MSIASREALSRYPELPLPTDTESADYQVRDFQARAEELRRGQMRAAYVYARTAEPTEAEIEAAVKAFQAWNISRIGKTNDAASGLRVAFEAARKTVAESRKSE